MVESIVQLSEADLEGLRMYFEGKLQSFGIGMSDLQGIMPELSNDPFNLQTPLSAYGLIEGFSKELYIAKLKERIDIKISIILMQMKIIEQNKEIEQLISG